jgi:hypothetical protein
MVTFGAVSIAPSSAFPPVGPRLAITSCPRTRQDIERHQCHGDIPAPVGLNTELVSSTTKDSLTSSLLAIYLFVGCCATTLPPRGIVCFSAFNQMLAITR